MARRLVYEERLLTNLPPGLILAASTETRAPGRDDRRCGSRQRSERPLQGNFMAGGSWPMAALREPTRQARLDAP
jgi:hypothetical protein